MLEYQVIYMHDGEVIMETVPEIELNEVLENLEASGFHIIEYSVLE